MSARTPGDWYAEDRGERHVILARGCDYEVASIDAGLAEEHETVERHEADARLIVAAPDLLESLERSEEMLRAVSEFLLNANPFLGQGKGFTPSVHAARRVAELIAPTVAAIAKARGGGQ